MSNTSRALEDLNDQFRHIAPKLQIISFYETLPTPIGLKNITVLEKSPSILGYPTETSKSLEADHHHVCKYKSTQDPNYISVRNALMTMVLGLQSTTQQSLSTRSRAQLRELEGLLAIFGSPSDDLRFFQNRWTPGTCEWVLSNEDYMRWVDGNNASKVLWLHALPASGKSILSSFIVNNLQETKAMCAHYFFRFGDQTKRSDKAIIKCLLALYSISGCRTHANLSRDTA